ncbi:MAG: hypothetical protein PVG30_02010 [Gammaproteobacteria bacterium]|jgi:hypothetical protein
MSKTQISKEKVFEDMNKIKNTLNDFTFIHNISIHTNDYYLSFEMMEEKNMYKIFKENFNNLNKFLNFEWDYNTPIRSFNKYKVYLISYSGLEII